MANYVLKAPKNRRRRGHTATSADTFFYVQAMGKSKNHKPLKPKKRRRRPFRSVSEKFERTLDGLPWKVHDPDLGNLLLSRGWAESDGPNTWNWPPSFLWLGCADPNEFDGWMPTTIYVDPDTRVVEFVCDAKGLVLSGQQTLAYHFPTREALIDDLDVIEKFRAGDPFPPPLRTAARLDAGEFDALLGDRDARSRPITAAEIDALVKERDARSYPLFRSESTGNDE